MWLFHPSFFVSIVQKPGHDDLCVRARVREDLEAFRALLPDDEKDVHIEEGTGTDYALRLYATHAAVASVMDQITRNIDYNNFKGHVKKTQGEDRAHAYMGIWSIMMRVQQQAEGLRLRWHRRPSRNP